jgi:hypothetical protein
MPRIQVEQHIGDEAFVSSPTLGQIGGELQAVFVHGRSRRFAAILLASDAKRRNDVRS